ncbi:MAG TPA: tRNA uridine-5-carboxymethylaminomethyl(34) synthesis GTPase MnmE, partial [Candidatus Aminicenantes bacterium]|nr:tRNA uridine-5-carboxymethylaminomethyl(34) synthesis GTPase MnmE [Candidatus Aminicenantes bacterium]
MGEDAIVALATPPGRGAIALIRLSGMGCREIVRKVIPDLARRWEPRRATR